MKPLRKTAPLRRPDEKAEGGALADSIGSLDSPNSISPPAEFNPTISDVNTSAPCRICGGATEPDGPGWRRCDACDVGYRAPRGKAVRR